MAPASDPCDGRDNDLDGDLDEDRDLGAMLVTVVDGWLVEIDPDSGATVRRMHLGGVRGEPPVAAESGSPWMYFFDQESRSLGRVNLCSSRVEEIGAVGVSAVSSMEFLGDGRLVAVDSGAQRLVVLDPTGSAEPEPLLFLSGSASSGFLAYDCSSDWLFLVDRDGERLISLSGDGLSTSSIQIRPPLGRVVGAAFGGGRPNARLSVATRAGLEFVEAASGESHRIARLPDGKGSVAAMDHVTRCVEAPGCACDAAQPRGAAALGLALLALFRRRDSIAPSETPSTGF